MGASFPAILTAAVFVLGTVALVFAVYFAARATLAPRMGDDTQDLAGSVIFRVSALLGLILALVFAQELVQFREIRSALISEATAVADIYHDVARYGTPSEAEIQQALSQYVREVINVEWALLSSDGSLADDAWVQREHVYLALLDLEPETTRQETLRAHMMQKIQLIAELRQMRENAAIHNMSALFWTAALAGIVLVTLPYFTFRPSALNLLLLAVYGGFTGLVLFIIYALSDPFGGPGALPPAAFEQLAAQGIG
ncbi:MAG: hypothetical protein AAF409_04975 [Pseudomonadota bacterium]